MPLFSFFLFLANAQTNKQKNGQRGFLESRANQISINENIRMMKKLEIAFADEEKWAENSFLAVASSEMDLLKDE